MSSAIVGSKRGLVIGTRDGLEDGILAHLTLRRYDIHQAEEFCSVIRLLENNDYNFILYLDNTADDSGPEFLRSIIPIVPDRKIIVLLDGISFKKYAGDIPQNIYGFLDIKTDLFIFENLMDQAFNLK